MGSFNSKSIFKYASKSDIIKIITITSLFFVVLQFTRVTFLIGNESDAFFYKNIYSKLALPATFKQLLYQPWSLITYMFCELSFLRILADMIWLWIFGTVIEDLKGPNRIIPVYLLGGIVGALFMLGFNAIKPHLVIFPYFADSLASLSAVAIATLMYKPRYKFSMFFRLEIPIWVFVFIFFALNVATVGSHTLSILFFAIGGVVVGLGYTSYLDSFFEKCTMLLTRFGGYISNNENYMVKKKQPNVQNEIDRILDKINKRGLQSLSVQEKRILDEYGQNI